MLSLISIKINKMNSNWTITKVTTTIQSNSSLSGGKGVIFHIYDIQSNKYSEYFIKEVRRGSLYCKCTNSKCETYLNVFPGPLINIIPNGISKRRKLYKIDGTIPHSVLLEKTNYNGVDHYLDKEHTTRCRDINLRLCSATTHAAPREIRGRISSCEYTVDQSLKREWAKVATGLTEKNPTAPPTSLKRKADDILSSGSNIDNSIWGNFNLHGLNSVVNLDKIKYVKKKIKIATGLTSDSVPDSLKFVNLTYPVSERVQFIYQFERFTILTLPHELRGLNGNRVYLDGTFRWVNGNQTYKQIYIISRKVESDNKVRSVPVVFALMLSKKEEDYVLFLNKLKEIHNSKFPDDPTLNFKEISTDFEIAVFNACKSVMPTSTHFFCAFHFLQNMRKRINNICKGKQYFAVPYLVNLFNLLRGIIYVPWSRYRFLINHFFNFLENEFRVEVHDSYKIDYDSFISYLRIYYFTDTNKHSFINWDFNSQILDTGNVDVTNNTAEALNSKFNSITGSRYQTYHSLLSMISDYKKDFFENVTLSQIRDNKLRTRPKSLIRKYEVITEYLYEYEDMTTPEKLEFLLPLLTALHSIPKDPSVPYESLQSFLPN